MLIPIAKPEEREFYKSCQELKELYKDGKVVGVYAASYINDQWYYTLGKTVLRDNKVETIDRCVICGEESVDWKAATLKFISFLDGADVVINYAEYEVLDSEEHNIENIDIEKLAMWCQYYFHYRGIDTLDIEYARSTFEYGEGVEGIDMYEELTDLINIILADYEAILEQDEERNISE
ncbi:MAG: hypothetical protein E7544_08485 [Ruminococcaceae bacterium]|nr:hypothetical protein [Oscillospiraceae bacterium]